MTGWPRYALIELRACSLSRGWLLLVGLGAIVTLSTQRAGLYDWADRASSSIVALTVLTPLMAAMAALDATRLRRHNLRAIWRSAPDGGVGAMLALIVAQWVAASSAFAAVALIGHLPLGVSGVPTGRPLTLWLVSGLFACALASSLGAFVGSCLPFIAAVVATPVVAYASFAFLVVAFSGGDQSNVGRLSPSYQTLIDPFFAVDLEPFALQAVWFGSCAVALACLSCALLAPWRRRVWMAAAGGVAVAVVAGGVVVGDRRPISPNTQAAPFRCADSRPVLCLPPTYEPVRDQIHRELTTAAATVAGSPLAVNRVEVRPRGVLGDPSPGAVALNIDDLDTGWGPRDMLEMMSGIIAPDGRFCESVPGAEFGGEFDGARAVVAAWAAGDENLVDDYPETEPAVTRFDSFTSLERRAWLEGHREALCRGTAPASAVGP